MSQPAPSFSVDFSPTRLSYVAALRGIAPIAADASYTYASFISYEPDHLICLAASNPNGTFYGIVPSSGTAITAQNRADTLLVSNIHFVAGTPSELLAKQDGSPSSLPTLDYLVCDMTQTPFMDHEQTALYDLAAKKLSKNGLFSLRYVAHTNSRANLQFLIQELVPDMTAEQKSTFLQEIKALSPTFLDSDDSLKKAWNDALAHDKPDLFFSAFSGAARSETFSVMESLLPRQMAFVGDAAIGSNYLQLSTPRSAHDTLISCHDHLFYEVIKDFACGRLLRNDVWCRNNADVTEDLPSRFGPFTFGILSLREAVPDQFEAFDLIMPLTSPLYLKLIDLMTTQPVSIGDFLAHASGQGEDADEVLNSIQTLVAMDIAKPMRTGFTSASKIDASQPAWKTPYNRIMVQGAIATQDVTLASPIVGTPVTITIRDALVLQAITRVGLKDSVTAIYPELVRVAMTPALSGTLAQGQLPTPESAKTLVETTVSDGLVRWYAYGLLAA